MRFYFSPIEMREREKRREYILCVLYQEFNLRKRSEETSWVEYTEEHQKASARLHSTSTLNTKIESRRHSTLCSVVRNIQNPLDKFSRRNERISRNPLLSPSAENFHSPKISFFSPLSPPAPPRCSRVESLFQLSFELSTPFENMCELQFWIVREQERGLLVLNILAAGHTSKILQRQWECYVYVQCIVYMRKISNHFLPLN